MQALKDFYNIHPIETERTQGATMTIEAINKKHQRVVNTAYKHYRRYHDLVNAVDLAETTQQIIKLESKQAKAFERYIEYFEQLPKREQASFERQHKLIHGYT